MIRRGLRAHNAHWLIPLALTAWAWLAPGGHRASPAVALVMLTALLLAWPLIAISVVYGLPGVLRALVPREWRARWRYAHPGSGRHIPARIRRAVLAAYRHRCVWCHADTDLQVDHLMPWSRGGLTSLWNLTVLCALHNRVKSDYWRYHSGRSAYRPWDGAADELLAAAILRAERRARANPLRWLTAAWVLALT